MKNLDYLKEYAAELVQACDHYFDVKLVHDTADTPEQEACLKDDLDSSQEAIEEAANKLRARAFVSATSAALPPPSSSPPRLPQRTAVKEVTMTETSRAHLARLFERFRFDHDHDGGDCPDSCYSPDVIEPDDAYQLFALLCAAPDAPAAGKCGTKDGAK